MTQWPARVAFTTALVGVTVVLLVLTFDLQEGSRLIPLSVACALSGLLLVQFVRDVRTPSSDAPLEWGAVGWVAVLAVLILLLGPLLGPAFFVAVYANRKGREGWLVSTAGGVTTALALWFVIARVLGAPVSFGAVGTLAVSLLDLAA